MIVAVFADMHAHAEAFDAVLAATAHADERWSLGDMVGTGPDPEHVVAGVREHCRVALLGNHDYQLLRLLDQREREPPGERSQRREPEGRVAASIELARSRLDDDAVAWMRSRKPAARRTLALGGAAGPGAREDEPQGESSQRREPAGRVGAAGPGAREDEPQGESSQRREPAGRVVAAQLWHGGPHNAVHEFVGPRNAPACLERQREPLGLVGHTHVAAAFHDRTRRVRVAPGEPLDISVGKWLLNPGPVIGVGCWLELDLEARTATWHVAPFDPRPAADRARALGLASLP